MRAYFIIFLFIIMALPVSVPSWAAAPVVPPTCDSGFYDVMSDRAWMEGQREMEVAHKLILKPDSVLQYSCFTEQLGSIVQNATFGAHAAGLTELGLRPRAAYYQGAFGSEKVGGLFSPATTCGMMYAVWDFLKCHDFDKDNFVTFKEIVSNDLSQCNAAARNTKWQEALVSANPPPAIPAALGGMAKVTGYFDLLDSTKCGNTKPVPTGLIIMSPTGEESPDAACVAPGCYYDGQGRCQ